MVCHTGSAGDEQQVGSAMGEQADGHHARDPLMASSIAAAARIVEAQPVDVQDHIAVVGDRRLAPYRVPPSFTSWRAT